MKFSVPEISWHNRDPVLSLDFQHGPSHTLLRLASGGTDAHVVIWNVKVGANGAAEVEFLADLHRHQKAVNIVRFSPTGEILASGDDEAAIILWKQNFGAESGPDIFAEDSEGNKEQWSSLRLLKGHLEDVCDLSWSPDSAFLASGSVDNTAIIWEVAKGGKTPPLSEHKGFVQGVAWDPLNCYLATLSSDRIMRVFNLENRKGKNGKPNVVHRVYKSTLPVNVGGEKVEKNVRLYHDDTLKTYSRRLAFSPDGELLLTPCGILETEKGVTGASTDNVTYAFTRLNLGKPAAYMTSKSHFTVAVSFCPVLFELHPVPKSGNVKPDAKPWERYETMYQLPYRMVFAVAADNSVFLHDTQQTVPFGQVANVHYTRLTDLSWSPNGRVLAVSSTDGYCSLITFAEGELGVVYKQSVVEVNREATPAVTIKKKAKKIKKISNGMDPDSAKATPTNSTNKPDTRPETDKSVAADNTEATDKSTDCGPVDVTASDKSATTPTSAASSKKPPIQIRSMKEGGKHNPKRLQFYTLSGPSVPKAEQVPPVVTLEDEPETPVKSQDEPETSAKSQDEPASVGMSEDEPETLPPSVVESDAAVFPGGDKSPPLEVMDTDSQDLKLVLENSQDEDMPTVPPKVESPQTSKPPRTPRRVQLITLSSPKTRK